MLPSADFHWDDFRTVKAIADRGSAADAANDLRINQSTVLERLSQIEQQLGAPLFERRGTALTPTPLGARMAQTAAQMADAAAGFSPSANENAPQGKALTFGLVPVAE